MGVKRTFFGLGYRIQRPELETFSLLASSISGGPVFEVSKGNLAPL